MWKSYGIKITLLSVLFTAGFLSAFAQNTGEPLSSRAPLNRLADMYRTGREFQMKLALQLAAENQRPVFRTLPGDGILQLERVEKLGLSVYIICGHTLRLATTTMQHQLWPERRGVLNARGASS